MFYKLLIKFLKKHFNKFSPEQAKNVRELVNNETIGDTMGNNKVKKKEKKIMADEKEVKEVETEKVETETPAVETEEKVETNEKAPGGEEVKKETETETKTEEVEKETETPTEETAEVQETEPTGNAVRVEDLVTKEELTERFAALEAKLEAVLKENVDLKNELSNKSNELNGIKEKYEEKDFGNFQRQGVAEKDKYANSSFDEYSKAFM